MAMVAGQLEEHLLAEEVVELKQAKIPHLDSLLLRVALPSKHLCVVQWMQYLYHNLLRIP